LIGLEGPDDAAVWRIDSERALVVTTDFFTPVVDQPYDFGSIAAANSLSDVYAMGGRPALALNIAAFPPDFPAEYISEILRGGAEKALEAGVVIAGGHTIRDKEPKFGLAVVGFVHPERILTKRGFHPGDVLVLTKPLGFGVTTTALKEQKASVEDVEEVTKWMVQLNQGAASLASEFNLTGATDVTGFGLMGHGMEVADGSKVCLRFIYSKLPFISCAGKYAAKWTFPGGASDNRLFYGPRVRFETSLEEEEQMLLFDPQTSGGLLLSVPRKKHQALIDLARKEGQSVWTIGEVIKGEGVEVV